MSSLFERAMHAAPRPELAAVAPAVARFLRREEIGSFAAWQPPALPGRDEAPGPVASMSPAADRADRRAAPPAAVQAEPPPGADALRQAAYQEGYRDGLAALEGFRQSHEQQVAARLGGLLAGFAEQFEALEARMAEVLAQTARDLARQVVRHELATQPELVASVAREAIASLLLSARSIVLRVHPEDEPLVAQGLGAELDRRGARLVADAGVSRGGVCLESDLASLDASIESRWRRAAAALGGEHEGAAP